MTDKGKVSVGTDRDSMTDAWQMLMSLQQAGNLRPNPPGLGKGVISFTLITGFLGSGKTTLVNSLLNEQHGMKIAIIVNDFGSVNIDADLIEKSSSDSISLANGCVCCTLTNGLMGTISDLVGRETPPDHIILEASGIAEPYAVIQVVLANPALRLNGIVCVTDAERLMDDLATPEVEPVIRRQAKASDLIIVNKTDVASPENIARLRAWITEFHPKARILETSHGKVPAAIVVGIPVSAAFQADDFAVQHSDVFASVTVTTERPYEDSRLRALLDNLPPGVLRVKGFIRLASNPEGYSVLQSTVTRWTIEPEVAAKNRIRSEVVVIGLRAEFDPEAALRAFGACEAGDY